MYDQPRKPGPERWWTPKQFPTRLPIEHHEVYAKAAEAAGLSLNAYIVWKLAEAHDLEIPAALKAELAASERAREEPQGQLPLAATG